MSKKKLIVILSALITVLSVSGCSEKDAGTAPLVPDTVKETAAEADNDINEVTEKAENKEKEDKKENKKEENKSDSKPGEEKSESEAAEQKEDSSVESENKNENSDESENEDTDESEDTPESEDSEEDDYSFSQADIDDDVHYGVVSGMKNKHMQDKINKSLKSIETDRYDQMKGTYESECILQYSDSEVLSVLQKAKIGESGSSLTYLNFNLKNGEVMKLSQAADIKETAEKIFNGEGAEIADPDNYTLEDFYTGNNINFVSDVVSYLEKSSSFWYDTDGNLMISIFCSKGKCVIRVEN